MACRTAGHLNPFIRPGLRGVEHFQQGREAIEREFARAPEDIRRRSNGCPPASTSKSPHEPFALRERTQHRQP